ncbi:MAG: ABC transporter permease [Eubacterium sp.]|nr:ABC transporter permease [Eubacterium sp.]
MEEKTMTKPPIQWSRFLKDNNSILILVVLLFVAFLGIDGFTGSFYNVLLYSAEFGICCLGLALVMITGNIDLSVGYNAAFSGVVMVTVFNMAYGAGMSSAVCVVLCLLAALVTGGILGTFNGFIVTKIGVSPLIATIATNYIYQGLVLNYARKSYPTVDKQLLTAIAKYNIFGIKWLTPMVIIFVLFVVGVFFWMYKTGFGNRLHIVGDNPEAAEYAGISVSKTAFVTFILCGVMAGMTGFLMVAFNGSAIYTQGITLGTFPISCCVIGGIKMTGGKGTAVHVMLGILIMRCLSTMMSTMFWSTERVNLVTGVLLILVLIVDRFTSTKSADE